MNSPGPSREVKDVVRYLVWERGRNPRQCFGFLDADLEPELWIQAPFSSELGLELRRQIGGFNARWSAVLIIGDYRYAPEHEAKANHCYYLTFNDGVAGRYFEADIVTTFKGDKRLHWKQPDEEVINEILDDLLSTR